MIDNMGLNLLVTLYNQHYAFDTVLLTQSCWNTVLANLTFVLVNLILVLTIKFHLCWYSAIFVYAGNSTVGNCVSVVCVGKFTICVVGKYAVVFVNSTICKCCC